MKNTIGKFLWLALCGGAMHLVASPPIIGVARSWGAFFVNNSSVWGNATVFDGSSLKTTEASSNLDLTGGERVLLSTNSVAVVHADRMTLDRGVAEFGGSPAYHIEVQSLRIATLDSSARIRVAIDHQSRVAVVSLGGPGEVRNGQGRLVARLASGAALTLSTGELHAARQAGAHKPASTFSAWPSAFTLE